MRAEFYRTPRHHPPGAASEIDRKQAIGRGEICAQILLFLSAAIQPPIFLSLFPRRGHTAAAGFFFIPQNLRQIHRNFFRGHTVLLFFSAAIQPPFILVSKVAATRLVAVATQKTGGVAPATRMMKMMNPKSIHATMSSPLLLTQTRPYGRQGHHPLPLRLVVQVVHASLWKLPFPCTLVPCPSNGMAPRLQCVE